METPSDEKFEKVVSEDGTPIAVWRSGAGPPLVLVHGTAADHTRWAPVLPALEERFTVLAIDRRGRGPSGDADDHALEREVQDVAAVIDWAGNGVNVLGHSYGHIQMTRWRWLPEAAPNERSFLEWFYLWIYTPRAHNDGTVDQIIEEVLAFPHKQSTEDLQRAGSLDTTDRLSEITAPTLVLAGGRDLNSRPELCRAAAELIPGARFEVMKEEARQPSRRSRTSGTPGSTPSGARSRRGASRCLDPAVASALRQRPVAARALAHTPGTAPTCRRRGRRQLGRAGCPAP